MTRAHHRVERADRSPGHHRQLPHLVPYRSSRRPRCNGRFFANEEISVVAENGLILATPTGPSTNQGLVFYPGAKVDPYAYLPTFEGLIAQGLTVVVVEPLFNMALF